MALYNVSRVAKNILFKTKIKQFRLISSSEYPPDPDDRTKTYWHQDWLHGPYPKTKEERDAAAKKYNLLPEDYRPFPEEEGFGDYPNLDLVSAEQRNPFEPYDCQHLKRNFGEPMHIHFDLGREEFINEEHVYRYPKWRQVLEFVGYVTTIWALLYIGALFPFPSHLIPKQYPFTGETYYTFEPNDAANPDDDDS